MKASDLQEKLAAFPKDGGRTPDHAKDAYPEKRKEQAAKVRAARTQAKAANPNGRISSKKFDEPNSPLYVDRKYSARQAKSNADKGITMYEKTNLVKNIRRLLETEVSQAEVMMAAKGFAQELQEMVEKIGRLQNEDLPPVVDQMRETYGADSASAFQTQIYGALQGVMDSLYTAKGQVDDAVGNMAETGQVGAAIDMDKDLGAADEFGGEIGMDQDLGADTLDLDNIGDEVADDEFGGAVGGEEPLGRAMKTEATLQNKILEMQKMVARARRLREAQK